MQNNKEGKECDIMVTKSITVRVDDEIEKQARQIFTEIGVPFATAINVFLRQSVRCGGFPFELKLDEPNSNMIHAPYNDENAE